MPNLLLPCLFFTALLPSAPPGSDPQTPPPLAMADVIVAPTYTTLAQRAKVQGTVQLALTVAGNGRVDEVRITAGLPMGLSEAAVQAAELWRFPADSYPAPVSVGFEFVLLPFTNTEPLPDPAVVTPHRLRIHAWAPDVIRSSHGVPPDRRHAVVVERPFSRLLRASDGSYGPAPQAGGDRCSTATSYGLEGRARAFCLPGSTLRTGGCATQSEATLLSASYPEEDSWVCEAGGGNGNVRSHARCCWPD